MDGSDVPTLEVGFSIDTGMSEQGLAHLQEVMNSTEAKVVAEAASIERATAGMVDTTNATAGITSFGNAVSKEAQNSAREFAKIEKSGEGLIKNLQRQSDAYGLTREEVRRLKVEQAAADAERVGNIDLAKRLRAQEAELYDKEFAAMRRNRAEAEALAEERAADAKRAEVAAEEEARALRNAALAHQMFEARVRAGAKAMREQDAAEQSLITRTHALKAAIDPAWAAQQRFDVELAEARSLIAAGAISLDDYSKRLVQLQRGLEQTSDGIHGQVAASGLAKAGFQQLTMQANDAVTMWAMQAPLMQIFVSQAGQVFQALVMIADGTGKAGKGAEVVSRAVSEAGGNVDGFGGKVAGSGTKLQALANFMTGPWGAAVMIATIALAPFIAKLLDQNGAVDDAIDKLKEQAKQEEITRAAQERFKNSAEGVAAAIRNGTAASKEWLQALDSAAERANIAAKANLAKEMSVRRDTLAEIERAKVLAQNAKGSWIGANGPNGAQSIVANQYAAEVERLEAVLKQQEGLIAEAEKRVNMTRIELAAEAAARMSDPIAKINKQYNDEVENVKRAAAARVQAGQTITSALTTELGQIEANRAAALKAEQDRSAAAKQTNNEIGRTITLLEARAIAEKAGGRVTSEQRSSAKQQELYDKYLAYKNGTGPWAALAAKPGTSNHEKGLALDIAKTDGMTLAKLVKAYRVAGVKLTEALDEGSHFHIAWAAGKAATEAAKEADKVVQWLQDQRLKAQGNVWQLMQDVEQRNKDWGKNAPTVGEKMLISDEEAARLRDVQREFSEIMLGNFVDDLDQVSAQVDRVAANMRDAFGSVGGAIGGVITVLDEYGRRQAEIEKKRELGLLTAKEDADLRKRAAMDQVGFFGDLTASAKDFFKEGSDGYKAMAAAEKAFRAIEFALSLKAMAQDAAETAASIANSGAKTAVKAVEAVVSAISSLPFPLNLAAGAATIGFLASLGVAIAGAFSGSSKLPKANDGTGTVLGDSSAQSESIKRSLDALKEVDTLMLSTSREMAVSLKSIDSQIGNFAALVLRTGDINASDGISTGFAKDTTGKLLEGIITGGGILSKIPIVGGIIGGIGSLIGSLFGTKTKVVASGLYGGSQSLEDILAGGFDADYYSDVQKKKKFFGLTTSTKYATQYSEANPELENQFTLILRSFNNAIVAAAGPLGAATDEIQARLNGFVVNIGKIDLQGLTGDEIEEKLTAVFGAAADDMAKAAFPGLEKFQQVGEGMFETLVRVASTVEAVTASLALLGAGAAGMSIDLKMSLADQFDSVSDFTSAIDAYFQAYYTKEEQAAARTAQFADVFDSLGLSMPSTLATFRALVEAQDLTTAAGQATYATLLQLAPAFADLQSALNGAKSAADILTERQDLERKLLEVQGDTEAIRALDLAKLDESNRALQQQIWALQDAKEAADAAEQLKNAWKSVGDTIMDEVNRIRGVTDGTGAGSFAALLGQFNAAAAAAKGGDQDAASSLAGLSQSLLQAAELSATSRQELDRVKAQTAATLEAVYASIMAASGSDSSTGVATGAGAPTGTILSSAATAVLATSGTTEANDNLVSEIKALRQEVAQMRSDNNAGHAANASNTGAIKRKLDDVTAAGGGQAVSVTGVAA